MAVKAEKNGGEASFVYFIDPPLVHPSGLRFHITFRDGVTQDLITQAFDSIDLVVEEARSRGYAGSWKQPKQDKPQDRAPQEGQPSQHRWRTPKEDEESGTADISKLKITGTEDKPVVEMYSPVPGLKYPFFKPPYVIVRDRLLERYPAELFSDEHWQLLGTCGKVHEVAWEVDWTRSPNNPKWLDVTGIRIKKLEGRRDASAD